MKAAVTLLAVFAVIGLIAGMVLVASGKIAFAGVVWAITAILSCIARRIQENSHDTADRSCIANRRLYDGMHQAVGSHKYNILRGGHTSRIR